MLLNLPENNKLLSTSNYRFMARTGLYWEEPKPFLERVNSGKSVESASKVMLASEHCLAAMDYDHKKIC